MAKTNKSVVIAQVLEREALNGNFNDDGQLQTIRQLAERFSTTPVTISRAVDRLARRGILEKQHGRGIFVKRNRVKSVGVVLERRFFAEDTGYYFSRFLAELETAFQKRRWACQYFINIDSQFGVQNFDYAVEHQQIEAVVFASQWFFENRLATVEARNIACIGIFRNGDLRNWVTHDGDFGYVMAFEELRRSGCKKIGLIHQHLDDDWNEFGKGLYWKRRRYAEDMLGSHMIKSIPLSSQAAWQAMKDLMQEQQPDGMYIENEVFLQGVIPAILALGLSSPKDVVIAASVTEGANWPLGLPIIELRVPIRDQAETIAEIAVMINAGQKPEKTQFFMRPLISNPFLYNSCKHDQEIAVAIS